MSRSTLICVAAALAALVSLVASATTAAGQQQRATIMRWTIDGVQRHALVYPPRTNPGAAKHPLVIAFHGHNGHMWNASVRMHIHKLWPQAIVVYPQGLDTTTLMDRGGDGNRLAGESG